MIWKFVAAVLITGSMSLPALPEPAPLEEIFLEVAVSEDGTPEISQHEFKLSTGKYYRFNFVCTEAGGESGGFQFESVPLLSNSHLRIVSVGNQEIHMQGLNFHALQCDESGTIRFSFYPVRAGAFEFLVQDHAEPPNVIKGNFIVE